jgi:hypothetical protein
MHALTVLDWRIHLHFTLLLLIKMRDLARIQLNVIFRQIMRGVKKLSYVRDCRQDFT